MNSREKAEERYWETGSRLTKIAPHFINRRSNSLISLFGQKMRRTGY
jgi:hypothetical protein